MTVDGSPSPPVEPPTGTPADLVSRLRAELCAFVDRAGTRRALPTTVHVGTPGGRRRSVGHDPGHDAGLRADALCWALDALRAPPAVTEDLADWGGPLAAWVTRGGELDRVDADTAWFAAAREAFARHDLVLPGFFVVTRRGWVDLGTADRRTWRRVRPRR